MVITWEHQNVSNIHMIPKRAICAGKHDTGESIYVARAKHLDYYLPAKVIPDKKVCYISWKGEEVSVRDYELITGDHHKFEWMPASNGFIHPHSVSTGTVNGEEVFIGRAVFNGSKMVGRVQESEKCIFLPFDGKEYTLPHYELLVYYSTRERRKSSRIDFIATDVF
jgi:hypothetical protein